MGTRHIENTTASPMFVGGKLIPPGTGRDIDEALLPPERQMAPEVDVGAPEPTLHALVLELHAKSVKDIAAELPELKQEALEMLLAAEQESAKPRVSLVAAIEAERLHRANARFEAEAEAAAAAQIAELTDEQRADIGEAG